MPSGHSGEESSSRGVEWVRVLTQSWCVSDGCVGKRQASRNAADKTRKEVGWAVTEVAGP